MRRDADVNADGASVSTPRALRGVGPLLFLLVFAGAEPLLAGGERTLLRAPLHVLGLDAIDSEVGESMLLELNAIFRPGGIEFSAASEASSEKLVEVVIAERPERRVIQGCRRGLHDHRLGVTSIGRRRIVLWTHQIQRAVSGEWDRKVLPRIDGGTFGKAIGRVLAHELGHLLLRLYGHHDRGLMRSSFSHRSLASRSNRSFRLSSHDLSRIRDALGSSR